MEQEERTLVKRNTHHGHAIKRLRLDRMLSQKELGDKVAMVQQTVYHYEDEEKINDVILQRFAKALDVSVDFIKELEEEKTMTVYIEYNQQSNNAAASLIANNTGTGAIVHQEDKELYKTLLEEIRTIQEENRKCFLTCVEVMKKQLSLLEKQISHLKE